MILFLNLNHFQIEHIYIHTHMSRQFSSGVPWEDLYANDLVIIAELLEECVFVRRLLT